MSGGLAKAVLHAPSAASAFAPAAASAAAAAPKPASPFALAAAAPAAIPGVIKAAWRAPSAIASLGKPPELASTSSTPAAPSVNAKLNVKLKQDDSTPKAAEGFAVQAGAFADRTKAERIADTLSRTGPSAVRPVDAADGRHLYRVVVGPWRETERAVAARIQVAALGFPDAKVVAAF
jgi:cell division septation protein DedD